VGMKGKLLRSRDHAFVHANCDTDIICTEEPPLGSMQKPEELYGVIERFCNGRSDTRPVGGGGGDVTSGRAVVRPGAEGRGLPQARDVGDVEAAGTFPLQADGGFSNRFHMVQLVSTACGLDSACGRCEGYGCFVALALCEEGGETGVTREALHSSMC